MQSFKSFGIGFGISFVLLFLILVAQFRSFIDPFLIMLAIPMGFVGVLIILPLTHTTLNVMSLMGVLMLVGIADSNSILIVDFAHKLEEQGLSVADAVITACRVRLRPILMTSLATIIGMIPMALKLGTGGEQYTPMARAIIGGLTSSVLLTVFIVPAAYLLVYGRKARHVPQGQQNCRFGIRLCLCARVAAPDSAHADAPTGRSAGGQESSANSGRAERSELRESADRDQSRRLLSERDRRRDRIAGQQSGANRRGRSSGFAPVRSRRPGRRDPRS